MPGPIIAPPGSNPDARIRALEDTVRRLSDQMGAALQIPNYMRGGTVGQTLAGGKPASDPQGLIQVLSLAAQINAIFGSASGATWTQIFSSTTVTVPTGRSQNFLVFGVFAAYVSGSSYPAGVGRLRVNLNGQLSQVISLAAQSNTNTPDYRTSSTFLAAIGLTGGTYTLKVEGNSDVTAQNPVVNIVDGTVNAFLYGG